MGDYQGIVNSVTLHSGRDDMSRSSTTSATAPQMGKPMQTPTPTQPVMTHNSAAQDKVAARAYQKWMQKGCKHGTDTQDWLEAEAEIKAEMARTGNSKKA